jgi:hypothetical protein
MVIGQSPRVIKVFRVPGFQLRYKLNISAGMEMEMYFYFPTIKPNLGTLQ